MPLPVIAITNVSACLTDAQVETVLPALQKQVSERFQGVLGARVHSLILAERPAAHCRIVANHHHRQS